MVQQRLVLPLSPALEQAGEIILILHLERIFGWAAFSKTMEVWAEVFDGMMGCKFELL